MVPRTVLTRSGPISLNVARPVNTVQPRTAVNNAGPMKNVINNAYSTARRPFNKITAANNSNSYRGFNTIIDKMVNGNPQQYLMYKGVIDSGCSRHMTGNKSYLIDYEEIDRGFVTLDGYSKGGKIIGQNVASQGGLTCLFAKAIPDESNLWPRRLGHVNFKTMNKLVKGNLVRGYSTNSKAFRVFNSRTRIVEENLHVQFSENTPNITGSRPNWLFDIDALTNSMNYKLVVARNQSNGNAEVNVVDQKTSIKLPNDPNIPELEDIVYSDDDDEDVGAEADMNNLDAFMPVSRFLYRRIHKDHPVEQIIRDLHLAPQTRRMRKNLEEHGLFSSVQQRTNHKDFQNCLFACFLSQEEPKKVYRNKKDERGIVIKNKARLVAQGYIQEEGIYYDEVFAPVSRIEAIRLFLAYASFKDFVVYQMDVKSAFLYGKIEEEVYVCQPPGFEDPDFPDRVYKVEKALYGLHQAPRAWYETLSTYLLDNGFQRGKIDKTLFIRRDKGDILLVQVYVDDIIFGSTKKSLCTEFEKMMHKKFQMSSIGELTFFLGLQVKQKEDGIFISQDKYVTEILKKFGFSDV
ncbi:putative ribonuclease H-like domain-containing protein [Tanacetum coccineum]